MSFLRVLIQCCICSWIKELIEQIRFGAKLVTSLNVLFLLPFINWIGDFCFLNRSLLVDPSFTRCDLNEYLVWYDVQVPIGGCHKLIDIPMSNCINSGISKIFVLTQFNSASLNRHISRTYTGNGVNFGHGFVEVKTLIYFTLWTKIWTIKPSERCYSLQTSLIL